MTFKNSNHRNDIQENDISIKIRGVECWVLTIPKNKLNLNNCLELKIEITNNKIEPFHFNKSGILNPQILDQNGQTLHIREPRVKRKSNKHDDYLVLHGKSYFTSVYAKICWQNNKLQLQIYYEPTEDSNFWIVDDIKPGNYRLKFIYRTNIKIEAGIESIRIDTQFTTLRLIESVKNNNSNSVVEVDGVRFETLVPQPRLIIPNKQPEAINFVQFGLRVTNLSSIPYRFNFHGLKPEIQSMNGQLIRRIYHRNATIGTDESHFLLAMPKESLTCFIDAELRWYLHSNQIVMQGRDSIGGYWSFQNLNPGNYRVRFTYKGSKPDDVTKLLHGVIIENLWRTTVHLPFIDFNLVAK